MAEEDEDVVLAGSLLLQLQNLISYFLSHSGSALHRHLLESGLGDVELSSPASSDRSVYNAVMSIPSPTINVYINLKLGPLPVSWRLLKREIILPQNFWCHNIKKIEVDFSIDKLTDSICPLNNIKILGAPSTARK